MLTNLPTVLRQAALLSLSQEQVVVEHLQASGGSTPEALITHGLFSADNLAEQTAHLFGLPLISLTDYDYEPLCEQLGLRELITQHRVIPIAKSASTLTLASADPTDLHAEDDFRFATGLQIDSVVANYRTLESAIRRLYGKAITNGDSNRKEITQDELAHLVEVSDDEVSTVEDLSQDDSPVSRFINQILVDAVRKGASDIHFEP